MYLRYNVTIMCMILWSNVLETTNSFKSYLWMVMSCACFDSRNSHFSNYFYFTLDIAEVGTNFIFNVFKLLIRVGPIFESITYQTTSWCATYYSTWVSHRVVVSALHSGWENPSSSLPINFELELQLLLQYCHNI